MSYSVEYCNDLPVYQSLISGPKISDTLTYAKSIPESLWNRNATTQWVYGDRHGLERMFEGEVIEHVYQYCKAVNVTIPTHINPEIKIQWLLRLDENSRPFVHCHPTSWISGVLHLMDMENGGELTMQGGLQYKSKAGQITLFSSDHIHWVEKYKEKMYRYSVSFDIYPIGVTQNDTEIFKYSKEYKFAIDGNSTDHHMGLK